MRTSLDDITSYLHANIPLTAAMGLRAARWDGREIVLAAPLAPNINHRLTLFGGSAAAAAIVAGWTLVWLRLREAGVEARLVIQRHAIEYEQPVAGAFEVRCALEDETGWEKFFKALRQRGKARLALTITLHDLDDGGARAATATGDYVAIGVISLSNQ